jgi:hypothetical protein
MHIQGTLGNLARLPTSIGSNNDFSRNFQEINVHATLHVYINIYKFNKTFDVALH